MSSYGPARASAGLVNTTGFEGTESYSFVSRSFIISFWKSYIGFFCMAGII